MCVYSSSFSNDLLYHQETLIKSSHTKAAGKSLKFINDKIPLSYFFSLALPTF